MAYVLCSHRLSSKLVTKSSLYSSSSPLSYLITHYELLINPKISSSFSSILNRNYNSTGSTPYFSSIKNPSKSYVDHSSKLSHLSLSRKWQPSNFYENVRYFSSSSKDDKKLDDDDLPKVDKLYFLSEEGQKFLYELSKGKYFSSTHGEFLKVLPKDPLNNITCTDLGKGADILLKKLDGQNFIYTILGSFSFVVMLVAYKNPFIAPFCFLYGCMLQIFAANERRSMKKVKLLMQDIEQGQIQTLFLQLLHVLKNSDDRDRIFTLTMIGILLLAAVDLSARVVHYIYY